MLADIGSQSSTFGPQALMMGCCAEPDLFPTDALGDLLRGTAAAEELFELATQLVDDRVSLIWLWLADHLPQPSMLTFAPSARASKSWASLVATAEVALQLNWQTIRGRCADIGDPRRYSSGMYRGVEYGFFDGVGRFLVLG